MLGLPMDTHGTKEGLALRVIKTLHEVTMSRTVLLLSQGYRVFPAFCWLKILMVEAHFLSCKEKKCCN